MHTLLTNTHANIHAEHAHAGASVLSEFNRPQNYARTIEYILHMRAHAHTQRIMYERAYTASSCKHTFHDKNLAQCLCVFSWQYIIRSLIKKLCVWTCSTRTVGKYPLKKGACTTNCPITRSKVHHQNPRLHTCITGVSSQIPHACRFRVIHLQPLKIPDVRRWQAHVHDRCTKLTIPK